MKKFIGKKLSMIIDQKITFVDLNNQTVRKSGKSLKNYGVKLLRECDSQLKATDIEESPVTIPRNKRMKQIRKRTVEPNDRNEKEKLSLAAIEPNAILVSTKYWTNRPKATLYEYKTNGSMNIIQEAPSEFTQLKRRNNWDATKIATYRKKSDNVRLLYSR